jgi:hypothetical protein
MFAKIKNNQVITFPYGYDELCKDNPYTKFKGNIDLKEIFSKTEFGQNGYELVDVEKIKEPPYDPYSQILTVDNLPTLVDGKWILNYHLKNMTLEESLKAKRNS